MTLLPIKQCSTFYLKTVWPESVVQVETETTERSTTVSSLHEAK
jgi:hypothetical protein